MRDLSQLIILFRGAGDLASGAALRLYLAGLRRLVLLETPSPMAVRRSVSFSEAVYQGQCLVEGVRAELAQSPAELPAIWDRASVALLVDSEGTSLPHIWPDVEIDATLAKRNVTGICRKDAPLVIALGPGFVAGEDAHCVVESNRGPNMGRVIRQGEALPDTGKPGTVMGYNVERVLRAPINGLFRTSLDIGDRIEAGASVGFVLGKEEKQPVQASINGVIRGLLRDSTEVEAGTKLGDIEPRDNIDINLVSDKSLALGGAILESILAREMGVNGEKSCCGHPNVPVS